MNPMNLGASFSALASQVEQSRPIEESDWYDDYGILHCGKCGAYLEHIVNTEKILSRIQDYDRKKEASAALEFFKDRKLRVTCLCNERDRKEHERKMLKQRIKENRDYCFGKTPLLMNCVFELDDSKDSRASSVSRRYAEHFSEAKNKGLGLLYWGDVGHGKTFLACAVANKLIDRGYSVKYTSISKLIAQAISYGITIQAAADGLCDFDLVVIDDFGVEEMNERNLARAYTVINTLYERGQSYVMTTNLSEKQFANPPSTDASRIYSRILAKCTPLKVTHSGGDRRRA